VGYSDAVQRSTQFGTAYLRLARELEPGFVFTVEPGLYFIPELIDQWRAEKKFEAFHQLRSVRVLPPFRRHPRRRQRAYHRGGAQGAGDADSEDSGGGGEGDGQLVILRHLIAGIMIGKDLKLAKSLLETGQLVAIPTETVYGLAGNAYNAKAVSRRYSG
jgi:hypothetical protein